MKYNTGCIEEYLSRWLESKLFSGAVVQLLQVTPIFCKGEALIFREACRIKRSCLNWLDSSRVGTAPRFTQGQMAAIEFENHRK